MVNYYWPFGKASNDRGEEGQTQLQQSHDSSTDATATNVSNILMTPYSSLYRLFFTRSRNNVEISAQIVPLLSDDHNNEDVAASDDIESSVTSDEKEIGGTEDVPSNPLPKDEFPPNEKGIGDDSPSSTSQSRFSSISRVIKLVGRQSFYLYIGCIVLVIRLPFSLSIPHFVSATLGALGRADFHLARYNILLLFIMGTIDAVLDFWCVVLFGLTSLNIVKCLRVDLFSAILKQDMAFFDSSKSPELASRLSSDCGAVGADLSWFFRFS